MTYSRYRNRYPRVVFGSLILVGEKLTDQVYLCYGGELRVQELPPRVLRKMESEGLSEEEA